MSKFEVIEYTDIYAGRAFNVRRDKVLLPNGHEAQWDIVVHVGAVVILPIDAEGNVWLVRQYRHPVGIELLELPAGTLEPGEDPAICAGRELQEEIGMAARNIKKIGGFYPAPGYTTEFIHVYLASDMYPDALPQDDDEDISVVKIPLPELERMLAAGELQDAKTIAGLAMARPHLS